MDTGTQLATQQTESTGPRIYVACLAAYNNGYLHGHWIDADQGEAAIWSEIAAMLKTSPIPGAEEWAIHDYEGFEGARISEYTGIDHVVKLAAFIAEHGELGGKLLAHFGEDTTESGAALDEYAGEYKRLADFAAELTEQSVQIPESLANYIDYEAMARDMELGGDVFTITLGFERVHVFWSCQNSWQ